MHDDATFYDLRDAIAATYPNADIVPVIMIPWGEVEGTVGDDATPFTVSGLMVDTDAAVRADDDGGGFTVGDDVYRIGIYTDMTTDREPVAFITDIPTAASAWNVLEFLTEEQPDGTDWSAWATHWVDEIWPDTREAYGA